MTRFKKEKNSILISTDLAGWGLDITGIETIIHFDFPSNFQRFIHRNGWAAWLKNTKA